MLQIGPSDIRWMIRRDMAQVVSIDKECDKPINEVDFTDYLRQRDTIGMVLEHAEDIYGYMIYSLGEKQITLLRIAVKKCKRRQGVGRAMVEKMKAKLAHVRRSTLATVVRDHDLEVQLFLRACGLTCCHVEKNAFVKPEEDGYLMEFCKGED